MEYKFSAGLAALKPSMIREILKSSGTTIPLAAGNPAPDAFPVEDVRRLSAEVLAESPILALQYGISEGYTPLVETLLKLAKERYGAAGDNDGLIVVSGAQQVMSLASQSFLNPGDAVICEEPSFIGALNCFRSFGAKLVGVPIEADGMDLSILEEKLKTEKNVKFIYTIPNFQNPGGTTMSWEKRQKLYALAKAYGVLILEDNPYGDLRVSGADVPAIKSIDTDGLVLYSGSFSKIVAPGIRVGFVVAPKPVIAKLTVAKQTQDVHTPMLTQLVVYKWLTECDFVGHIEKIRGIYRRKLNLLCDCLDAELGDFITYHRPEGGLFVWAKLRDDLDMLSFCKAASAAGVSVVPGVAFMVDETAPTQYIRLNFSTPSDDDIVKGVRILGAVARDMTAKG
ncbi:MAG: PLP-dependent aminotransferase family protein [Clostridia bacterium]|nr:PLP-dependent aminotransferase family protein [Clostridia bacterium]